MLFNPAFEHCPDEALIIARILGGYGGLEPLLALCLANVLGDNRKALRVMFRSRGETPRINTADALIASDYELTFESMQHEVQAAAGVRVLGLSSIHARRKQCPSVCSAWTVWLR